MTSNWISRCEALLSEVLMMLLQYILLLPPSWVTGYADVLISTVNQNFPEMQLGEVKLSNIKDFLSGTYVKTTVDRQVFIRKCFVQVIMPVIL